jgi:hypothetical protein
MRAAIQGPRLSRSRIVIAPVTVAGDRTDDAGERVHPELAQSAGEQQVYDDENRHRRVGEGNRMIRCDLNPFQEMDRKSPSRRILPDRIPQ